MRFIREIDADLVDILNDLAQLILKQSARTVEEALELAILTWLQSQRGNRT